MKYLIILLLTLTSGHQLMSQTFSLEFDHIAIPVSDLQKSADFYADVLNLKEIPTPGNNPILRWFDLGNSRQLHLIEFDTDIKLNKGVHFALNTSDLEAFIKHLDGNGISYEDWLGEKKTVALRPDGIRQIYIKDPDGHWIEINDAAY